MNLLIREEQPDDIERITDLTQTAFFAQTHSNHTEHRIIDSLRGAQALAVSLVAEVDGEIVGHIAFSEVDISDNSSDWYGLGPLSVASAMQGKGIGRALIRAGLDQLRRRGTRGCLLVGDPFFCRQFGIANNPDLLFQEVPQDHFLALPLAEESARSVLHLSASLFQQLLSVMSMTYSSSVFSWSKFHLLSSSLLFQVRLLCTVLSFFYVSSSRC